MKVINLLPHFRQTLDAWPVLPSREEFEKKYVDPLRNWIDPLLIDFGRFRGTDFYQSLEGVHWAHYRAHALHIDPQAEETRLRSQIDAIEKIFSEDLKGEAILWGAFTLMDGFARFDRGKHRVYIGADESHGRGAYLDILEAHELAHVVREGTPEVWEGWGLNPKMSREDFINSQPKLEHLFGEGFSCVISEIVNPNHPRWLYTYQTQDSLDQILEHAPALNKHVHSTLEDPELHYSDFYKSEIQLPSHYAHYVWAWQWVKSLLRQSFGGDIRKIVKTSSQQWLSSALAFELTEIS